MVQEEQTAADIKPSVGYEFSKQQSDPNAGESNPWRIRKTSPKMLRQQNAFKWQMSAVKAVQNAHAEEAEESSRSTEEGNSNKAPSAPPKLDQLLKLTAQNVQGLKGHLLMESLLKPCEERTDEDLDRLQVNRIHGLQSAEATSVRI